MLSFNGRVRRTARTTLEVARSTTRHLRGPGVAVIRTHWWENDKNFGDLLTSAVLPTFGIHPVASPAATADLIGIGSLLHEVPTDSTATVFGAGIIHDEHHPLPLVRPAALRGHLTRERIETKEPLGYGDPGLLLSDLVRSSRVRRGRWRVGVVPHFVHREDEQFQRLTAPVADRQDVTVIDVRRDPLTVAAHIASCEVILTSSLHGLITADSFGIPALWMTTGRALFGGAFKFHDHETVTLPARPRHAHMADLHDLEEAVSLAVPADAGAVDRAKTSLVRAGRSLTEMTPHLLVRGIDRPRTVLVTSKEARA